MSDKENPNETTRRDLLGKLAMSGGLLASALLAARHGFAFIFPRHEVSERRLLVGRVDELAPGEAKEFDLGGQTMFMVNTTAGLKVFSGVCPHLGCKVKWEPYRNRFYCPCHKGVFDADGRVVDGPPPRPLDEYAVETENSLVYIRVSETPEGGFA